MPELEKQFTPEEEIRELERKLEEKKRELAGSGGVVPQEKEMFRGVFKERMEDITRAGQAKTPPPAPAPPTAGVQPAPQSTSLLHNAKDHQEVEELVVIAFSKGLVDAVEAARRLHSPHLLDEFHDTLVDEYYDKLVAMRGGN